MMTLKKIKISLLIWFCLFANTFADTKTILLLGQSGTGKTTTLNALYNAAMFPQTPENSLNTIEFLTALDRNESQSIPPEDNLYFAENIQRIDYGRVTRGNSELTGPCSSDTDSFTGYRFTPQLKNWPQEDELEIIDTPGIDDTGSTLYDNHSTHLQVIRQIEQLLREKGDSIHAIVMVVNNWLNRLTPEVKMTLHAIGEALPPKMTERLFVVVNYVGQGEDLEDTLQEIINDNLSWQDGNVTIPAQHYIPENPTYLARFNQYLNGSRDPKDDQAQREYTEHHLRELLQTVSTFNTPIPLDGYPQYLQYKHQVAKNAYESVKIRLEVDTLKAEFERLHKNFKKKVTNYNRVRGKQDGDIDDFLSGAAAGAGVGTALIPFFEVAMATTPVGWAIGAASFIFGVGKFFAGHTGIDDPHLKQEALEASEKYQACEHKLTQLQAILSAYTAKAQTNLNHMQTSRYGISHSFFSKLAFASEIRNRVQVHFPQLYQYQKEALVNQYINEFCQMLKL